jgi:hypothetical protein
MQTGESPIVDFLYVKKSRAIGAGRQVRVIDLDPVGKPQAHWLHVTLRATPNLRH